MKTSISAEHPFGVEKIVVHRHLFNQRVIIDPEDPSSVIAGLRAISGCGVAHVEVVDKVDHRLNEWKEAVKNNATLLSFKEWTAWRDIVMNESIRREK